MTGVGGGNGVGVADGGAGQGTRGRARSPETGGFAEGVGGVGTRWCRAVGRVIRRAGTGGARGGSHLLFRLGPDDHEGGFAVMGI